MPSGQIRRAWLEGGRAYMTVGVVENPDDPSVENNWTGSVLADAAFQALTAAQKRAALIAAVKAVRDASAAASRVDLGINGAPVNL